MSDPKTNVVKLAADPTDADVELLLAACGLVMPKKHAGGRPPQPIKHGRSAGYKAHYERKQSPCGPCARAYNAYQRARYAALKQQPAA